MQSAIVDCKTTVKGSTGRMFWVRGVADFFAADAAYMVREREISDAARQLTSRLRISALTSEDLTRLESLHPSPLALDAEPLSWLFDRTKAASELAAFNGLDRRLKPLLEYREFNYWLYEEHRNPLQLVANLRAVSAHLDPRNPLHLALVLDCAWLYLVTLSHAVAAVRTSHVSDPDRGLQEYLFGGPSGLREKQELSRLLDELRKAGALPENVHVDPLPTYFPLLRELTTRILRRPDNVLPTLRLLEFLTAVTAIGERVTGPEEMGGLYEGLAAKQAADVVGYLVTSAQLDAGFRTRARSLLLGEPIS
ncbi:hypothetical protein ABUW04_31675 [Streptacidiphilus sp. N1-10]|uniref:Uncharacterized protein n=1 Tax=Streptacidiphilus jeojiensis TaxID=3229225 RepID=A0ABV6XX46_9ACTN